MRRTFALLFCASSSACGPSSHALREVSDARAIEPAPTRMPDDVDEQDARAPRLYRREGSDWILVPSMALTLRVPANWSYVPRVRMSDSPFTGAENEEEATPLAGTGGSMDAIDDLEADARMTYASRRTEELLPNEVPATLKLSVERLDANQSVPLEAQCAHTFGAVRARLDARARLVASQAMDIAGIEAHRCDIDFAQPAGAQTRPMSTRALFVRRGRYWLVVRYSTGAGTDASAFVDVVDSIKTVITE